MCLKVPVWLDHPLQVQKKTRKGTDIILQCGDQAVQQAPIGYQAELGLGCRGELCVCVCVCMAFVVVELLSRVQLFATPWAEARQASLSFTISWSLRRLVSIELVMPSNHLCGVKIFK